VGLLNIHFALAGDGLQFKVLSKKVRSLPNVTLLGWLDRFEISDLLNMSHVGLVPCISVVDAMPNKTFEYLSAGLPILSSLEGEMERIIADSNIGFSYRVGDIDAFCSWVRKLSFDEELRLQQSSNAKNLFHSRFSSTIVYGDYADYIENIGQKKGEQ
jgi:glycosyltransferase involved in cell wall biosynthesis